MNGTKYQVVVFGKMGCEKCKTLQQRLDKELAKAEWQAFEKVYCDVETEDGLLTFCKAECINPQRIPAFVVATRDDNGRLSYVDNPTKGVVDKACKDSKLHTYLGLQTDYTKGGGVIRPAMIRSVLAEAGKAAAGTPSS